jgi:glycosyltransferase involved in cell wall biosynthesis
VPSPLPDDHPGAITAVILVRDETARLPACLASLRGAADRVEVMDTGSTDGTRELLARLAADPAQEPPLRWSSRPLDDFSRARAALHARVTTPWLLWIDADERLSPALAAELARRRRERGPGGLGAHPLWCVPRRNHVLGRPMRARSLRAQRVARVGRTRAVQLSGEPVHEGLVLRPAHRDAAVGRLAGTLEHLALTGVRAYLRKIDRYTTLEARSGRSRYGPLQPLHVLVTGPATFWREWAWRGAWRDGGPGLVWALLAGWSAALRSWKVLRGVGRGR